ncbi:hypothetical protein [Rhodococcus maanshanensis]|uniref:Uncharacterized protein n=1 Tax=Rhodococcus maanshanensis TaxID=183556 RepID=A0A1H7W4A6_9NOCA|nr:hypothetical protein [Rhodococcus maanshanensis]SEM15885.1 hypothetical protein SAMN05444583_12460 [Rhodococcus maanshanensis]
MLRILARRGASVLAAAALLGGGLVIGAGTASADELPITGSAAVDVLLGNVGDAIGSLVTISQIPYDAWVNNGSIDTGSAPSGTVFCTPRDEDCPL